MRGKIIEIEGVDGCGKETQSKILAKRLEDLGITTHIFSFPKYGTPQAKPVESYLNGSLGDKSKIDPLQISALFAVDRLCTMIKYEWEDILNAGEYIVLDRYVESNVIYQAARKDLSSDMPNLIKMIHSLEYNILKLPRADCIIYLDLDEDVSSMLRQNRGNSDIHEDDNDYMRQVCKTGRSIAEYLEWEIINCTSSDKSIMNKAWIAEKIFRVISSKFEFDKIFG